MTKPTTHTFCKDKKGRRCTVAIRQDKELPNCYNIAVAVTSKEDNFSKNIGKKIVYGRLNFADNKGFLPSGVTCAFSSEACKYYLLNNFELTEKRVDMMINKDLLQLPAPGTPFSRALEREYKAKQSFVIEEEQKDNAQDFPF